MPSEKSIDEVLKEQRALFLKKLEAYGTKDITEVGLPGILNRLNEKVLRGKNLLNVRVGEEPLRDTFLDIMGYGLIGVLYSDNSWDDDAGKVLISRSEEAKKFALPQPKKDGDVGYDLPTCRDTIVPAHNTLAVDIPTGIKIKIPSGHWALVTGRSGALRKSGLDIKAGVIDNGYTGELFACCYNRTNEDILVKAGTCLVQFVVFSAIAPTAKEVDVLPDTERGSTGFGSTDK